MAQPASNCAAGCPTEEEEVTTQNTLPVAPPSVTESSTQYVVGASS